MESAHLSLSKSDLLASSTDGPASELAKAFVHQAIELPVNGVTQIVNKTGLPEALSGSVIPEVNLVDFHHAESGSGAWYAQQLGTAAGMLPGLVAINVVGKKAFGAVGGNFARSEALQLGANSGMKLVTEAALTGAAYEGLFRPAAPDENFAAARLRNAFVGGVSFGTMAATALSLKSALGGGAETFKIAGSERLANMATGVAGGATGAFAGLQTDSLLRTGTLASADDTARALATGASLGGMIGAILPVAKTSESTVKSAELKGLRSPDANTRTVSAASGELLQTRALLEKGELNRGGVTQTSTGHEVVDYKVSHNGRTSEVILHDLDTADPFSVAKLRKSEVAQELHQIAGFDHGIPASAVRTIKVDGQDTLVWVEQKHGKSLQDGLPEMAARKYGEGSVENVVKLIEETPELKLSMEHALAERVVLGDVDINPGNLVIDGLKPRNIDWTLSFAPYETPSWSLTSAAFELMGGIRNIYAGKSLSPSTALSVQRLVQAVETPAVQQSLLSKGLLPEQVNAISARGKVMLEKGFPEAKTLFEYVEEDGLAKDFFRANPMRY